MIFLYPLWLYRKPFVVSGGKSITDETYLIRAILEYVKKNPGKTVKEIAENFNDEKFNTIKDCLTALRKSEDIVLMNNSKFY